MWHTIQAHPVIHEFKDAESHKHPNITPRIVNNLFERWTSKVDVQVLKEIKQSGK